MILMIVKRGHCWVGVAGITGRHQCFPALVEQHLVFYYEGVRYTVEPLLHDYSCDLFRFTAQNLFFQRKTLMLAVQS